MEGLRDASVMVVDSPRTVVTFTENVILPLKPGRTSRRKTISFAVFPA